MNMEQQKKPKYTPGQRCAGGAIAVAVLAGLVSLPATSASAAAAAAQTAAVAQAADQSTTADLAVTHGLQFAAGDRVGLTGTAGADAEVMITGLPGKNGTVGAPATVRADHTGKWVVATLAGSALANSYQLAVTSGGKSIDVTTTADADYRLVERELTVPAGQRFVGGERPVVSGTADAYSTVVVRGLPGTPSSEAVGAIADENGDWSIRAAQAASGAIVVTVTGQGLGESKTVQEHVELEARAGEFEAFTIEDGLTYAPGTRLALSGEALPGSAIKVEGLPTSAGIPDLGPTQRIVADAAGKWTLFTPGKSATADGYDLTFTIAGSTRVERVTADEDYAPVERDFTVAEGQTFVVGEIAIVTGTADAFSTVRIDGLPGRNVAYGVQADHNGNWTATSAEPATTSLTVKAFGFAHGGLSDLVEAEILPAAREGEFQAFTVERGLAFVPGQALGLTGTALPFSRVQVDGLPDDGSRRAGSRVTHADVDGRWAIASGEHAGTADSYELTFTVGGSSVTEAATADPDLVVVEQDLAVAPGQSFVAGERAVLRGTADAFTAVSLRGLPGDPASGTTVIADADGKWVAKSGAALTEATEVFIHGYSRGAFGSTSAIITPGAQEETPAITVDTKTFVKGKKQLIEGTAAPKARVDIYSGSKYLMNVTANAEGKWSYMTGAAINDDRFTRTLKSAGAEDVTFTLTAAEQEQTPEITVTTETFVKGQKQRIEGTAAPKAKVNIYSGSKYLMNVTADGAGKWSYTTGAVITDDTFTRILKSEGAEDLEFTLTAAEQEQKAPITVVTTTFVKGQKQLIEGTAEPKAKVNIYSGSKYLMNVTANAEGKWSYTTGAVINDDTFTRTLKSEGAKDLTFTLNAQ
ncbi:hypothetical protein ACIPEP_05675 [Curtobacterium sp. NPDC087082]|uniref:hypothetical protein n=1 Tax=Curtobacterium sp. NPDC087082 TaxID=3363966 RepID=UPI00382B8286